MDEANTADRTVSLNIEEMSLPLHEAQNILRALRAGAVDGLIVTAGGVERVYTLSDAEHPYRVMIETMSEGAMTVTVDNRITYCNKTFSEMVRIPRDQLIGSSLTRLVTDASKLQSLIANTNSTIKKEEFTLKAADGSNLTTLFSVSPLQLDDTKGLCMVVTDLTHQKNNLRLKAETEMADTLRRQAETARQDISRILESITDSYIGLDRQWIITDLNERGAAILGKPRGDLVGNNIWELFPQGVGTEGYRKLHESMASNAPVHFEAPSTTAVGRWFEVHAHPSADGLSIYLRDITGRKQDEEERERLLTELAEANRRKDEFLAMLSHELRNPLAPIANALEVLRRSGADENALRTSREVIDRQVKDLARLIDDLLDASRISRGKVRLKVETVDLHSIVSRAIETTRPLTEARKHRLSVSLPSESVWLNADPTRLAQVLGNILNNAAKYTPQGGQIWLSAERDENQVTIRVRDTGIGILADMLPHVFDLFTQADRSLDRSQGGLGIGLTLARSIIEMHGGSVRAFSAGPNEGSEFVVVLPVAKEPAKRPDQGKREGVPAGFHRRRIMVVDDSEDSADMMALLLKLSGHEVAVASDGQAALDTASTFKPEIILLDIGLPGIHGYEVAKRLRMRPENKNLVIVGLTGYGQEQDRQRANEAGFNYHFVKPVDFGELESLLNNLSASRAGGEAG